MLTINKIIPVSIALNKTKYIYFVNNDPTTIGVRSLTIPRDGIGIGDSIAFYVWFLRIWYHLFSRNPHFMHHCASKSLNGKTTIIQNGECVTTH